MIVEIGIDDSDTYGIALDEQEGYPSLIGHATVEELKMAIEDLDDLNAEADSIIKHYKTITPLLSEGSALDAQIRDGLAYAQPKPTADFSVALEDAMVYA